MTIYHTTPHLLFYNCFNEYCVILGDMHSIASGEPRNIKMTVGQLIYFDMTFGHVFLPGSPNCGA